MMTRIIFALLIVLGFTRCTDDFQEINTDPNSPTSVPTSYIISESQRQLVSQLLGQSALGEIGNHYAQYLSQNQYTDVTRYSTQETSFYGLYRSGLQDFQYVIEVNTDEETRGNASASGPNANQIALAMIMQQWGFLNITDVWGDVPYTDALQGSANLSPVYDEQEEIYRGAVANLMEARDMIVEGSVTGDLIFGGDMEMWRKFANSLILRAGLRVSNVAPDLGSEWANEALNNQYGVMTSNADNAELVYAGTGGLGDNPWYTNSLTRTDYVVSEPLIDYLQSVNDPRLMVYAQPTANSQLSGDLVYRGKPYGVTEEQAGLTATADVSFPGLEYFYSPTSPLTILTYSEVLFNQSEAAARGWIEGDAADLYRQAIIASMNQYGITDEAAITDYLDQESVEFNASNFQQSIGQQKWLALYYQGIEGWSEWRRLGYPDLNPAPAALNASKQIPRRRAYTTDEFALNREQYNDAIDRQFGSTGDTIDGRVWWDVQ
ncbi:SusD-like starch-binding protein associating with outer membrane [Neolewinella xylanilytica]|uniref:SusD-like starch-binding protein associating with outer membrane n=1 Tax=Neolewinella xylanilytica TaxID=1514080 RepID=A0A2S6I024_9BACT|nr:SusD/RagB family nutrient-binding outer membrane lipoprotein [Neolewinella xylanilytica]PPK84034.1 SusD-like starch-binding protein associating with outer membrane [Neolewinella xylanilytica]